ncbi:hypothetical protein ACJJTC_015907, partial [Scirpophaga incertulas]
IHEQMTADELRNVFHVEHHSLVPDYHLVTLTHHLARRNIPSGHPLNTHATNTVKVPHDKSQTKSQRKWHTETSPPSLLNDEMFIKAKENIKDVDIIGDLNNTVSLHFGLTNSSEISDNESSSSDKEHVVEDQEVDVHKIDLEAFGKLLNLVLRKQEGLFKKEGLKVWKATTNESQPHGVDYEEMTTEDDEDLGELYQDEENSAALLIRRHPKHGKLIVEGSIGHELVIRPIPDTMTAAVQDDEMFLDPASMADMVSIDTGRPLMKRKREDQDELRRALNGARHVIIKRDPATGDHLSDY